MIPPTLLRRWIDWMRSASSGYHAALNGCGDAVAATWHLGFTAFGGPPVHFQIFHKRFVEERKWIDEQMYQELFGICQALPGPGSTKMLFCINSIHGGFTAGFLAFFIWSLPGAVGMYGLSLGISKVGNTLPAPVYALLSGLNAATVGIIALAAVQLAEKAITDKLTRVLVFLGGAAGMLYSALWYFPVLMLGAGLATITWDFRWLHKGATLVMRGRRAQIQLEDTVESQDHTEISTQTVRSPAIQDVSPAGIAQLRRVQRHQDATVSTDEREHPRVSTDNASTRPVAQPIEIKLLSWKLGVCIIVGFLASIVAVLTTRGLLTTPSRGVSLFANLYLAGTIIFGGGPVVIPLLREYIVTEGWVSPRDFLFGLAIIQSFPGPNFNFAVYLGSLAAANSSLPSFAGALIAFLGIFAPGLIIISGIMGFWKALRYRRWVISLLRGVNAAAVGLVYTAVYRLWQIGLVDGQHGSGSALGADPWWVTITATSFVGGRWFGLNAPSAILLGGAMGVIWYAVVET